MKKFLSASAVALVLCASHARAAGFQVDGVRVGPASEEKAIDTGDAPAPKKGEPKAASSTDTNPPAETKNERRAEPSKETATVKSSDRKNDKRAAEKAQTPSSLSNSTASTNTPAVSNKPPATSDAPVKPGADATNSIFGSATSPAALPATPAVELTSI